MKVIQFVAAFAALAASVCFSSPVGRGVRSKSTSTSEYLPPSPSDGTSYSFSQSGHEDSSNDYIARKGKHLRANKHGPDFFEASTSTQSSKKTSSRYDPITFEAELKALGLDKSSTLKVLLDQTTPLMSRYKSNSNASRAMYKYLEDIKVNSDLIETFRRARARIRNTSNCRKRRLVEKKMRAKASNYKVPDLNKSIFEASEKKDNNDNPNITLRFKEYMNRMKEAGVHYGLDPFTYAVKEFPIRKMTGSREYGQFNKILKKQNRKEISKEWRNDYRRIYKAIYDQRKSLIEKFGIHDFKADMIRRPSWVRQKYDGNGDSDEGSSKRPRIEQSDSQEGMMGSLRWSATRKRSRLDEDAAAHREGQAIDGLLALHDSPSSHFLSPSSSSKPSPTKRMVESYVLKHSL